MHDLIAYATDHPVAIVAAAAGIGIISKFLMPLLAACQNLLDSAFRTASMLLFVTKNIEEVNTQAIIAGYLDHKTRGYGNMDDEYQAKWNYIKPLERKQAYFVRFIWTAWRLWFWKRAPILMVPNGMSGHPYFTYVRGTIDWDKLVLEACAWSYDKDQEAKTQESERRFKIVHMRGNFNAGLQGLVPAKKDEGPASSPSPHGVSSLAVAMAPVGWKPEDIGYPRPNDPIDTLAMNEAMTEVEKQVEFWKSHQEWYKERGIPWKMGVLLYGPPGTGKTSLVRAIAMKQDMPVYAFDLSTMSSHDFVDRWQDAQMGDNRIVLLEDIDTVFDHRSNVIEDHRLSFDVILNTLDGIDQEDGTLLFVTTNRIECVDPALGRPDEEGQSTRPGRIDLTYEIGKLDAAGRIKIARRILQDDDLAEKMALNHQDDTPVVFRERCRRAAISLLWAKSA